MCWTWFKTIGHSSKNLGLSQKPLSLSWCPRLVTGLVTGLFGLGRLGLETFRSEHEILQKSYMLAF